MSETTTSQEPSNFAAEGHQFLTFRLQEEEYGIEILRVQEIKGFSRVTPIPNTPRFVRGVLNLRGEVVPILDLRTRFNMPETEYNQFTVIIVVNVASKIVGLVVDAVSDVLNVGSREIEPVPDLGSAIDVSYLTGMAKAGERLITLLNIDKLIDPESKISMLGA